MVLCSLFEEELAEVFCAAVPSSSFPGYTRIHSRFLLGESERIVSCQDDFEKLKDIVAPAGDLAIDHLNHVVSGLNTAGIYLLSFQFQNFLLSCLLIIISKLLHTMFTNISTGTSTKISHYHIIWPLIICSMNSANSPLPFHLADSTSEASFQFLIANTIFFLITFSFI